jgi:hypothetical protein
MDFGEFVERVLTSDTTIGLSLAIKFIQQCARPENYKLRSDVKGKRGKERGWFYLKDIARCFSGEASFDGIFGYSDTVIE